ncbi:MAG TPA: hypothetical protein VIL26_05665 [Clostridia bacterium]
MHYKAGQVIPYSGKVVVLDKYGEKTNIIINVKRGEVFPETSDPDQSYLYISYSED